MRQTFLLFLLAGLLGALTTAKGQVDSQVGLRLGATSMTMEGDDAIQGRRTGWIAGGFARFNLPGRFFLQPELLYVQKGAEGRPDAIVIPEIESVTYEADYVELPLLAGVEIPTGSSRITSNLFAGPTVGYNVAFNREVELTGQAQSAILMDPKPFEAGLSVGIGGDVALGAPTISIDARYQLGLTDVIEADGEVRNRGFIISTGVVF